MRRAAARPGRLRTGDRSRIRGFCSSPARSRSSPGVLTGLVPGASDRAAATSRRRSRPACARASFIDRVCASGCLIAQAALSVVLLVGAGLFLRSLSNVENVRMGYDADRLLYVGPNARGVTRDSRSEHRAAASAARARRSRCPASSTRRCALTVPFRSTWELCAVRRRHRFGDQARQLHAAGGLAGFLRDDGDADSSRPRHSTRPTASTRRA